VKIVTVSLSASGMIMKTILCFWVAVIVMSPLGGCQSSGARIVSASGSSQLTEAEVMAACVEKYLGHLLQSGKRLAIGEYLSIGQIQLGSTAEEFMENLYAQGGSRVPADLIADFCGKNARSEKISSEQLRHLNECLDFSLNRKLILTKHGGLDVSEWDEFYSEYPDAVGVVTLSRVGFSKTKDMAMLYMGVEMGTLAGNGRIYVFRRQDGLWYESTDRFGPGWVK
jgi:hypothetical protein